MVRQILEDPPGHEPDRTRRDDEENRPQAEQEAEES
jgi:hypothetical protein